MKKLAGLIVVFGTPALALPALAEDEVDLAVSSDMVAVDYHSFDESRGSLWGAGLTYNEDVDATAVSATYNAVGDVFGTPEIRSGIGVKGVIHDTFQTAGSLAVGGSLRYMPEQFERLGFEGQLYYAPEILNTNDVDRYHEVLARVTYEVNPRAKVFAGWLDKTISYNNAPESDVELANGLNLGFTLNF